ncbi:hypothetical protein GCM10007103_14500 [Salinimicrobium marinum]|uniref:Uncharacterized protein n=1 Tax=Salinimicrobium marinum TaxID=680283 RepID=A0A918SD20_9FLAO|nr:hypothetical protein GCM10007103_14500 [Salinimicrobium marinum]
MASFALRFSFKFTVGFVLSDLDPDFPFTIVLFKIIYYNPTSYSQLEEENYITPN